MEGKPKIRINAGAVAYIDRENDRVILRDEETGGTIAMTDQDIDAVRYRLGQERGEHKFTVLIPTWDNDGAHEWRVEAADREEAATIGYALTVHRVREELDDRELSRTEVLEGFASAYVIEDWPTITMHA